MYWLVHLSLSTAIYRETFKTISGFGLYTNSPKAFEFYVTVLQLITNKMYDYKAFYKLVDILQTTINI